MLYEIEVRNTLTSWNARGKRLRPGLYLTEDENLANDAMQVPQHISVRELPNDRRHVEGQIVEIDHYIPYDGGTGVLAWDEVENMEGAPFLCQFPRCGAEFATAEALHAHQDGVDHHTDAEKSQTVEEAAWKGEIRGAGFREPNADDTRDPAEYSVYDASDQKPTMTEDKEPEDPTINPLTSDDATVRAGAAKEDYEQAEQLLGAQATPRAETVPAPAPDLKPQLRKAAQAAKEEQEAGKEKAEKVEREQKNKNDRDPKQDAIDSKTGERDDHHGLILPDSHDTHR